MARAPRGQRSARAAAPARRSDGRPRDRHTAPRGEPAPLRLRALRRLHAAAREGERPDAAAAEPAGRRFSRRCASSVQLEGEAIRRLPQTARWARDGARRAASAAARLPSARGRARPLPVARDAAQRVRRELDAAGDRRGGAGRPKPRARPRMEPRRSRHRLRRPGARSSSRPSSPAGGASARRRRTTCRSRSASAAGSRALAGAGAEADSSRRPALAHRSRSSAASVPLQRRSRALCEKRGLW